MIRICATSPEDLASCETRHIVRVFSEISSTPKNAKEIRGNIFLSFPSYDNDPRPNSEIPEVQEFICKLDQSLPHFPYFLASDILLGHIQQYLYCLLRLNDQNIDLSAFQVLLERKITDVRLFCKRIADHDAPAIQALLLASPPPILRAIPELQEQAKNEIRPALEALKATQSPEAGADLANKEQVISRAAAIWGIDPASYLSLDDLLDAILMGRATS